MNHEEIYIKNYEEKTLQKPLCGNVRCQLQALRPRARVSSSLFLPFCLLLPFLSFVSFLSFLGEFFSFFAFLSFVAFFLSFVFFLSFLGEFFSFVAFFGLCCNVNPRQIVFLFGKSTKSCPAIYRL